MEDKDIFYMKLAIEEAKKALEKEEVPIGCVIVYHDEVVASSYNRKTIDNIATSHAEILAINEACKKLVSLDSENPVTALRYVEVCSYVQKYNEAYNFISKLYKKNPDDELILQAYVLAYSKTGKRDDVLKFINSLLPETANKKIKSDLLYQRSFLQKMEENQLADLRSSLMEQPRNSKSLFRLYEIYFEKKDYRKAQYYLKQVVAINPNDMSMKKLNETSTKLIK